MLNIQFIRENAEIVKKAAQDKGEPDVVDELLAADSERRDHLAQVEAKRAQRNVLSKEVSQRRDDKEYTAAKIAESRAIGEEISALEEGLRDLDTKVSSLLAQVANVPHPTVPFGKSEEDNVEVRRWGKEATFDFQPKPHWDLGKDLDIIDLERGGKITGAGFILYKGQGARLERSLINLMLDLHTEKHGYKEVWTPALANRASMIGTAQIPKLEMDMYRLEADDLFLIPTGEVPVTNIHRDEILEPGTLPVYYVTYTPCFRREAGAAGKDTRGLLRVHQFDKVELVKLVEPETSFDELEKLVADAEEVLQILGLTYRVMLMCTAELGFAQAKKYDLEVWSPGVGKWLEVSSCSNFTDFQARRANIRYRPAPKEKPDYVHTLNGSGIALARTVSAILETYQRADGRIDIPEALRPYMGGAQIIG